MAFVGCLVAVVEGRMNMSLLGRFTGCVHILVHLLSTLLLSCRQQNVPTVAAATLWKVRLPILTSLLPTLLERTQIFGAAILSKLTIACNSFDSGDLCMPENASAYIILFAVMLANANAPATLLLLTAVSPRFDGQQFIRPIPTASSARFSVIIVTVSRYITVTRSTTYHHS